MNWGTLTVWNEVREVSRENMKDVKADKEDQHAYFLKYHSETSSWEDFFNAILLYMVHTLNNYIFLFQKRRWISDFFDGSVHIC